LSEFIDWTKYIGIDTHWQSLYQPEYLDPLKLGPAVRELAVKELKLILARNDLTDSERSFFTQAEQNYHATCDIDLTQLFCNHIEKNETIYHLDQAGKFSELWPELSSLL
jgi:hypothetical protein